MCKGTDEDEGVGADHEQHVSPSKEPPGREPQQQMDERPQRQAVDQHAQREDSSRRWRASTHRGTRRYATATRRAPVWFSGRRHSASTPETRNERPTVSAERQERALVVLVVAREDEDGSDGSEYEPARREHDE